MSRNTTILGYVMDSEQKKEEISQNCSAQDVKLVQECYSRVEDYFL